MGQDYTIGSTRRDFLRSVATIGVASLPVLYHNDRNYIDSDEDGIPDVLEDSEEFNNYLDSIYGDQFEGLDSDRKDLLIDIRYIGDTSIYEETKNYIEHTFRDNDIYAQVLDHPIDYNEDWFHENYETDAHKIIWPINSFYSEHIEDELKNIAIQLIVIPDNDIWNIWEELRPFEGLVKGVSFGNRAVVTEQSDLEKEISLNLHEIGHAWLCHDYDNPDNIGVMGTKGLDYHSNNPETIADFMPHEWEKIRDNLDNVRDTTGADILGRECIAGEGIEILKDKFSDQNSQSFY